MIAAELLTEAVRAGVSLRLVGGTVKVSGTPPQALLDRLRAHKEEIVAILAAETCRHCGARPQPLELGGFSPGGWSCDACLAAADLLAITRGVVIDDDADNVILREAGGSSRSEQRRWHDDRAWIADLASAESREARFAVLGSWVAAAGGRWVGTTAELPRLPARLAALELRRMLRQAGIEVRDAVASAGVAP